MLSILFFLTSVSSEWKFNIANWNTGRLYAAIADDYGTGAYGKVCAGNVLKQVIFVNLNLLNNTIFKTFKVRAMKKYQ